jgi:hypothetical protein
MQNTEKLTALQQLFSDLEKSQPGLFNVYSLDGRNCINQFFKYLEIEEQQIKDAWEDGQGSFSTRNAEQYYNETFITKE